MRWIVLLAALAGCSTLSGARPLEAGQHEIGLVLGGPMLQLFGSSIPLPNAVIGGRSGLTTIADRPLDLGYGINATALPFGVVALHGDMGWLALDQNGAVPALTVRNRLFFATNLGASGKAEGVGPGVWSADQIELLVSWKAKEHVVYTGVGEVLDFTNPGLVLVPVLGASLDPGKAGGLALQLEARWWAVNRVHELTTLRWVPGRPGALGVHLGVSYRFGSY